MPPRFFVSSAKAVDLTGSALIDVNGGILVPYRNIDRSQLSSVQNSGVKISCRVIERGDVFPTDVDDWVLFRGSEIENAIRFEASRRFDKSYKASDTSLAIEDLSRRQIMKTEIFGISVEDDSISIFFPALIFVLSISFFNKLRKIRIGIRSDLLSC